MAVKKHAKFRGEDVAGAEDFWLSNGIPSTTSDQRVACASSLFRSANQFIPAWQSHLRLTSEVHRHHTFFEAIV
jgi:hypothetical protein